MVIPLFFNIGGGELIVLLLVMLLVFGPKQAIDVARKTGKVVSDFKRVTQSVKDEIMKEDEKPSSQTPVSLSDKEMANKTEVITDNDEIAEKKRLQALERDKKETERTTTI
jgi:sec-independent protein translocase protein TatA